MTRLLGIALFLPVPVVLYLFTRTPLGILPSVALGVLLVATHRLYARPFALARASRRCLWCAGAAAGPSVWLEEPLGTTQWRCCSDRHRERLVRVLGWAEAHQRFLRFGILGTLGVFLPALCLSGFGRLGAVTPADAVALFRAGIAACVLPLGLLGPWGTAREPGSLRVPFPVHIQALIGTWAVLWLFRLMGSVWLVLAALHAARRFG